MLRLCSGDKNIDDATLPFTLQLSKYPQLNKLEQSVGVPQGKAYGAIGAFLLFTLLVFFNM